jgi:geranylgeranyl transferase type-2 subunit beta
MRRTSLLLCTLVVAALALPMSPPSARPAVAQETSVTPRAILVGLRDFFEKTAQPDGSFRAGIDPTYKGMADTAYSDLAAPTYAVVLHKTFGWKLPHEAKTRAFFLGRQVKDGRFVNRAGTVDPASEQGRLYNTTQGLVALRALGEKPKYDAVPVLDDVLNGDYKSLPPYTTSFFPLAYMAAGKPYPREADRKVRTLLVQAEDGYMKNHIAATFHLVHYYRLVGEPTPKAEAILRRVLREQAADGSWLINPPARDRHAGFDAAFILKQLGGDRPEVKKGLERAARWVLSCRNPDGGFGHYPGSPSDADAVYFHVGTLVLAGVLRPAEPPPRDPHLLGWGHLLPTR